MGGLLDGVTVLELGLWVAGPGAGCVLADWGADVIKLEPPGGEPMRNVARLAEGRATARVPHFDLDNRGKRSVVADLATPAGKVLVQRLVDAADVFLTNLRPGALDRLGLGPEQLLAAHPRLVYAGVTGYGRDGPDRDRPGYDIGAFWARSGAADMFVPPGTEPPAATTAFGDHTTAVTLVAGIMAALYDRERTGRGQAVETSLLRCGAYAMSSELAIQLYFGKRSGTRPRTAVGNPLMNRYCAGDGRWFFLLGIEADRHWPRLLEALDDAELAGDDRFSDVRKRRHNVAELVAILDRLLKARTRDEWALRFDAADVWWAPVLAADEVVADPQAIAAGVFVDVPDHDGSTYRSVATPLGFGAYAVGPSGPVPALGEHTRHVLFDLGYTTDEVAELVETGVIDGKR